MNELDAPLGLDTAEHDRACNYAAVAVFGLTALAILAGGVGWYSLRSTSCRGTGGDRFRLPSRRCGVGGCPGAAPGPAGRAAGERAGGHHQCSVTIIDGKTGKRETIMLGPDADDDDAPTGGIMPAAASMDTAPAVVRWTTASAVAAAISCPSFPVLHFAPSSPSFTEIAECRAERRRSKNCPTARASGWCWSIATAWSSGASALAGRSMSTPPIAGRCRKAASTRAKPHGGRGARAL